MGAWKRAEDDLGAALDIDPELVDALVFRASARRHLGGIKNAEADAEAALKRDSRNIEASLESGILHHRAGRKSAARDYLQRMDDPERQKSKSE